MSFAATRLESSTRAWGPLLLVAVAFVAVQSLHVTRPPVGRESWREADVLIVGRNYCEEHAPLWLPRVNGRGNTPGITGMEFPILNWVEGRLACAGYDQVLVSRIITLLFTTLALLCTGVLAGASASWFAAFLFGFSPLVWFYSTAIQPDMPALALMLLSLVLLQRSLKQAALSNALFFASALCASLGILVKLPVIVFGIPAAALVVQRFGVQKALRLWPSWLYLAIAVVPAMVWYHFAHELQRRYGLYTFFLGKPFSELLHDWMRPGFYREILTKITHDDVFAPVALIAAIMLTLGWSKCSVMLRSLACAGLAYIFLCGHHIEHHVYYHAPLIPILAIATARAGELAVDSFGRWIGLGLAVSLAVAMIVYARAHIRTWWPAPNQEQAFLDARTIADRAVTSNESMLLFSSSNPRLFWYLDRHGWLGPPDGARDWFLTKVPHPPLLVIDLEMPHMNEQHDALVAAFRSANYHSIRSDEQFEIWVDAAH